MDLNTLLLSIAAGTAGGGATVVTQSAVEFARDWLDRTLRRHSSSTLKMAEENTAAFVISVAQRVDKLEAELQRRGGSPDELSDRLASPDFAAVFQSALISAARTSRQEVHALLAAMIEARLRASEGDRLAIVAGLAVETLPKLTTAQLAFLGLRQALVIGVPSRSGDEGDTIDELMRIFSRAQQRFPESDQLEAWDFVHLAATSCASHGSGVIVHSLFRVAGERTGLTQASFDEAVGRSEAGQWIQGIWDRGGKSLGITTIGEAIAREVFLRRWDLSEPV